MTDRDGYGVRDEQERSGETQRKLPGLARRNAQVAPPKERIEPERRMRHKCGQKNETAGHGLPRLEQKEAGGLHGIDRPDPECMIEEVRCSVGKQDQSRSQTKRPLDRAPFMFHSNILVRSTIPHYSKNRNPCNDALILR
jgi:hypothetical protein